MTRPRSVCLYAASSNNISPAYFDLAERFGRACAERGFRLVSGGGKVGLMGAAPRACRAAGGETLGVIPTFLRTIELADEDSPLIEVASMHERKQRMFLEADAFVALPGGIGTLEEVIETLSWRRLELHAKPIAFLAEDGFWDPLFALFAKMLTEGFNPHALEGMAKHASSVSEVFDFIDNAADMPSNKNGSS